MSHVPRPAQPPRRQPPALFGRERELDLLSQRLAEARAGHGSLILVGGEAGIGKTTLVAALRGDALANSAPTSDALALTGHCYDLTTTPPYGPWVEMIGAYPNEDELPARPPELVFSGELAGVSSQATLFQHVLTFVADVSASRPLILVLEDLHWADDASLDLLRYLARGQRPAHPADRDLPRR